MENQEFYEQVPFDDSLFPIKVTPLLTVNACPDGKEPSLQHIGHWHEHLEILYIKKGGSWFRFGPHQYQTQDEDILVVNPSEVHHHSEGPHTTYYRFMIINPQIYDGFGQDICRLKYWNPLSDGSCSFHNRIHSPCVRQMVMNIFDEYDRQQPGYEIAMRGQMLMLLAALFREELRDDVSNRQQRQFMRLAERMKEALLYVEEHYAQDIHTELLAQLCGWNLSYFCRQFKKVMGVTAAQYINEYRISKAEALLKNSALPITDIAFAVGFSDSSYFSRCFKALRGVTPQSIRRQAMDTL